MLAAGLSTPYLAILAIFVVLGMVAALVRARRTRQAATRSSPGTSHIDPGSQMTVNYACDSYAVFRRGQGMRIVQVASSLGPVDFVFSTRYVDGWGPPAPGQGIIVEARCPATSSQRTDVLAHLLRDFSSVLSFSANAWVNEFAWPPGERSASSYVPDALLFRELDAEATLALLESLGTHPEADRFWDAIHSYSTALGFWAPGRQSLALAHLHKGVLAVGEAFIRISCENHGLTKVDLAKKYRVEENELLPHLLQAEFYNSDDACFRAGELASRAIDSGTIPADDGVVSIEDIHVSAARCLRDSLLRVLDLKEPYRSRLLGDTYQLACGLGEITGPVEAARDERRGPRLVRARYDQGYHVP
jgi:hypothetical protein